MSIIKRENRPDVRVSNPLSVCWQITKKCQLNCLHCIANSNYIDPKRKELTTSNIKKIIDKLVNAGIKRIDFSGGDPLLKEDILDILKYCQDRDLNLVITTNGLIYSQKISNVFKATKCLIQISIDGDDEMHDEIRGKGNFRRTLNNLIKFQNDGNLVRINFTISKKNYHKINFVYNLAKKLKVGRLMYIFVAPQGRGNKVRNLCLSKQQKQNILQKILRIKEISKNVYITIHDYEINYKSCFLIEPDGMVVSQGYSQDECVNVGKITRASVKKLWHSGHFDHLQHLLQYAYMLE